jgi:predicted ATPase
VTAIYQFGRFELRPATRQLLVEDQPAFLGARAFDVLLALVERRDRLVPKNELLDLVWPGLAVEENNLMVQVSSLRKILGQESIATVPGLGYRFALATMLVGEAVPSHTVPNNLPQKASSFIGRKEDVAKLGSLLADARLVTLIGPGGVGKTRLSLEVATNVLENFPDGAWLVELGTIEDPLLVARTVAQALVVHTESADRVEGALWAHLHGRRLLILLDNCEHLIPACADFAHIVLSRTPGVWILATSRQPLRVDGEHCYSVPALSVGGSAESDGRRIGSEAAQLFIERAMSHSPELRMTEPLIELVEGICMRLDGLPLAIELAAARTRAFTINEIAARIDQRFTFLTFGSRDAPQRQQTLRALLDWSYDLLSESEQVALERLGVFGGGFDISAAEAICSAPPLDAMEILDLVGSLVDKSLLHVEFTEGGSRYRMLETIRKYAHNRLVKRDDFLATERRHCDYFLGVAKASNEAALFAALTEEERCELAAGLVDCTFVDGEVIVRQDEPADAIYMLASGKVDVHQDRMEAGRFSRRLLATLEAPSQFGEVQTLSGEPYSATILARGDVLCFRLAGDGVVNMLRARPDIAADLATILARQATAELRETELATRAELAKRMAAELLRRIRGFLRTLD